MTDKDRALRAKDERAWSLKRLSQVVAERSKVRDPQAPAKRPRERPLKSIDGSGRSTP
jgi:hypothetical protein